MWRREMIDDRFNESDFEDCVSVGISLLIALRGPLIGRTFYLKEPIVSLGRQSSNDIMVPDPLVSRHHCMIRSEGGRITIQDLNSSNGTYVNRERVRNESLNEDSLIEIGVSQFLLRVRNSGELIAGQSLVVATNVSNSHNAIN